jgi:hypothetical protein
MGQSGKIADSSGITAMDALRKKNKENGKSDV